MMTELKTTQRDAGWFFVSNINYRPHWKKGCFFFVIC